jgi:Bacterial Ig domain
MNTSRLRRRGGKRTISSPLHPPLPRPDPGALAPLHLRLRAFGVAPTPDPDESWHQLRPLLRNQTVTPLQRLRRRGIRGGAAAAVALMVLVASVALAAEPVQRLVVVSAVSAWKGLEGLMDLAGKGSDSDSITRGQTRGGWDRGEEASPADGEGDGGTSDGSGSSRPGGDVADAPLQVRSDRMTVTEDTTTTINVLRNDGRFGGDVKLRTSQPGHGTAWVNNRTITYTPPANFNGSDEFTYVVSNGERSVEAPVAVEVTAVNDSPRAGNDKRSVDEDHPLVLDLLMNDGDVDGDELSIKPDAPAHGRVDVKDGRLTYVPPADFNGEDTFSYQVSDGKGGSAVAKVAINVRPVNDDPVAGDIDVVTTTMDNPALIDVLTGAKDTDDDPLTVTEATATHGKVDINPNGSLAYTPDPLFIGDDVISYTVSDGAGGTDRAKVMIHVVEPPPAEAETGSGAEGSAGGSSSGG